jgi:hypothetical protein
MKTHVEVLGPGQWWPGRLGDEDTRMPGPGPELVGSSRVAFCAGVVTEAGDDPVTPAGRHRIGSRSGSGARAQPESYVSTIMK